MKGTGLRLEADATVHLCVDMQHLFAEETAWRVAWLPRVLPAVVEMRAGMRRGRCSPVSHHLPNPMRRRVHGAPFTSAGRK